MFCVNLPINTNLFDNLQVKSFTQAYNKASESVKSNLQSKYANFDSTILGKSNDFNFSRLKSYFDSSNITTTSPIADSSNIKITSTITPPIITKFLDANKKEMVEDMVKTLTSNMKKTKQLVNNKVHNAVQMFLGSSDEHSDQEYTIYKNSTAEIDHEMSEVSSFEESDRYESDEDSIFEPAATTPHLSYKQACENVTVIYPRIKTKITLAPIYKEPIVAEFMEMVDEMYEKSIVTKPTIKEEPIVAQFIGMVEANAREATRSVSIYYTAIYVSEFFRMVGNDQHSRVVSIYDTSYVSGFFNMVEGDHYSIKAPLVDATSYTSDFFKMIEKDQVSNELKIKANGVTMGYIWLKIHLILSRKSNHKALKLLELSQLEIGNSKTVISKERLIDISKRPERKKKIPHYNSHNHPKRFRNSNFH